MGETRGFPPTSHGVVGGSGTRLSICQLRRYGLRPKLLLNKSVRTLSKERTVREATDSGDAELKGARKQGGLDRAWAMGALRGKRPRVTRTKCYAEARGRVNGKKNGTSASQPASFFHRHS